MVTSIVKKGRRHVNYAAQDITLMILVNYFVRDVPLVRSICIGNHTHLSEIRE